MYDLRLSKLNFLVLTELFSMGHNIQKIGFSHFRYCDDRTSCRTKTSNLSSYSWEVCLIDLPDKPRRLEVQNLYNLGECYGSLLLGYSPTIDIKTSCHQGTSLRTCGCCLRISSMFQPVRRARVCACSSKR